MSAPAIIKQAELKRWLAAAKETGARCTLKTPAGIDVVFTFDDDGNEVPELVEEWTDDDV